MARTLRDATIAFVLESFPGTRGVYVLDPPTEEYEYAAVFSRLDIAETVQMHYRLVEAVGREHAARVWLREEDPFSAPRALERAKRVTLDATERALAKQAIDAQRRRAEDERAQRFAFVLAEAILWCSADTSRHHRMRTPELEPVAIARDATLFDRSNDWRRRTVVGKLAMKRDTERHARTPSAVANLVVCRSRLLRDRGVPASSPATDLKGGRLLLWRPLRHPVGATEGGLGFLDAMGQPPWDTWVSWEVSVRGGDGLVCWVPKEWALRAEAAATSPNAGMEWLEDGFQGRGGD